MSPADSKNFHILVAEDNLVNQKVIGLYLKQMGHTFDCTENGEEAFQQYEHSKSYDLIIMDIHMPIMDGVEATQKIRQLQSPHNNIPIIALTANAMAGDREKYLAAGMDYYLSKPMNKVELQSIFNDIATQAT